MSEETRELTAEERQAKLNAAALDAAQTLHVSVETVDESALDESEFEFSLEEITETLSVPIRVFTFANPANPEKPFKFAMRQLTAEESAEIYGTLFDREALKDAIQDSVKDSVKGGLKGGAVKVDPSVAIDALIDEMANRDDFQERSHQRNTAAVFKCMVLPKKKSIELVQLLPRDIVSTLAEGCQEEKNRVWLFRSD